jgi:hypothetical protein
MNNGELHGKELLFGWTQYNAEEQQQLRSLLSQASYGRLDCTMWRKKEIILNEM